MATNVVNVIIHSKLNQFPVEKRYNPELKITQLKNKLELVTGANHKTSQITLFIDDKEIGVMDDDDQTLSHYLGEGPLDNKTVKFVVKDMNPSLILTQEGDAPKYVISEDKYLERPDNARNFIKEMREKRTSGASTGSASVSDQ